MKRSIAGAIPLLRSLPVALACAITSGCFSQSPTYGGANPQQQLIYVPYIEEVIAPATVQVGEKITITARLSTAQDASLLPDAKYSVTGNYFTDPQPQFWLPSAGDVLLPFLATNYGGDNQIDGAGNAVVFDGSTTMPGKLYFYIAGTQTQSLGGSQLTVLRDSGGIRFATVDLPQLRFVEVVIDVL